MHGQGKIRIGFSRVSRSKAGRPAVQMGGSVVCYPYIPSMVIKCQALKDRLSFLPFATLISQAHSFSPHLPGEKGLLAHWYTEMALAQN